MLHLEFPIVRMAPCWWVHYCSIAREIPVRVEWLSHRNFESKLKSSGIDCSRIVEYFHLCLAWHSSVTQQSMR